MSRTSSVAKVSLALQQVSFDTIDMILASHLDRINANVEVLVNGWSENGESQEGLKNALNFLYKSTVCERADLQRFLAEHFDLNSMDDGERESYNFFDGISRHCTGDFIEDDPLLKQCRFVNSFDEEIIKSHAAEYFKGGITSYLTEKFPQFSYENDELVEAQLRNVANDVIAPSSVFITRSADVFLENVHGAERK